MTDFVIILTTFPADKDPGPLAKALVEEKLAACVNILPVMESIYRWKDAVERADERQLVIKTARTRVDEIATRLRTLHPYDVPEFLVIPILHGSADYFSWLNESTNP